MTIESGKQISHVILRPGSVVILSISSAVCEQFDLRLAVLAVCLAMYITTTPSYSIVLSLILLRSAPHAARTN